MTIARSLRITEKQQEIYDEWLIKGRENLTDNQKDKFDRYDYAIKNKDDYSKLSEGCITELKNIYVYEKYNKRVTGSSKDFVISMLNGTLSEGKSLEMLSDFDGVEYKVNKNLIQNRYLKGKIDAYVGNSIKKAKKVVDIKTVANMQSLLSHTLNKKQQDYYWQIMGYLAITGAEVGEICYCCVTYPQEIILEEIRRYKMRVSGLSLPKNEIEKAIEQIRNDLTFDEIPPSERIIRIQVERNEQDIKLISEKVKMCREWLNYFDTYHDNLNKNL